MGTAFYIAQGIGVLCIVLSMGIQQFKDIRYIQIGNVAINLLIALQYLLLNALSGAWVCMVAAVQSVIMILLNRKDNSKNLRNWINLLFCAIYIAGTCVVYTGIKDLFSCAGALFFALAIAQTSAGKYRLFNAGNAVVWIIYNIYSMAYVALINQLLKLGSIIVAVIRLDIPKYFRRRKKDELLDPK